VPPPIQVKFKQAADRSRAFCRRHFAKAWNSRTLRPARARPATLGRNRYAKEATMKNWMMGLLVAGLAVALMPADADAKRLGGGKPAGMQRATPDKAAPNPPATPAAPAATPNTPATPSAAAAPTTGAAAAAAPKRSWMGPLAGLAAGLGIAALMSHLGLGEQFGSFLMLALLAVVAVVAIRFLMRRFTGGGQAGPTLAMAGGATAAPGGYGAIGDARSVTAREAFVPAWSPGAGAPSGSASVAAPPAPAALVERTASAPSLPVGFDADAFERLAKMIFIRLQAANDGADLNDLRTFTTPELFASLRLDLQERGAAAQHTDVVKVETQVLDFAQEAERQVVSVRFHGMVREEEGAEPTPFDEVWHLVKSLDDSRAWAIAGIQQRQ
jgi:predicted lipid-binding transport protein (Tim44 family)